MKVNFKASGRLLLAPCLAVALGAAARAQQPQAATQPQATQPAAPKTAAEALARYERAFAAAADPRQKFFLLTKLAATAVEAGEAERAKAYARDLLARAPEMRQDWNYGNAVHVGNLVLGRVALAAGDAAEAKRLLLEAGNTPGSPQLNSFGPNMRLAKELLEKGERDAVVRYLDAVARFWKAKTNRIDDWKAAIARGETPDFGPNLDVQFTTWRFQKWEKLQP
ncbi:MAG TPA: hypothetical protein VF659_11825 [Pyrinomonadaceae bacterium]|jgi:tetratricopeptide (TPR) repeat protein